MYNAGRAIVSRLKQRTEHHRRQADGTILTRIVNEGTLNLAPPGIELGVAEIFAAR